MALAPFRLFWICRAPLVVHAIIEKVTPLNLNLLFASFFLLDRDGESFAACRVVADILRESHKDWCVFGALLTLGQATEENDAGFHARIVVRERKLRQADHSQQLIVGQQPVAYSLQR